MNNHTKKIIAPVIIVLIIIAYYSVSVAVLLKFNLPNPAKIAMAILSVIMPVVFTAVLIERIKEIKKGEEDDLGKY